MKNNIKDNKMSSKSESDLCGKKILIFSTGYFPFVGGAEVAVKEITNRINDVQFDLVTAKMGKLPKEEKIGNVNVYRFGVGIKFLDKYLLALFGHWLANRLHKKNNYDVVWAIMASHGGFAASAFKKKNPNVPFLLTLQEGDPITFIKFRAAPLYAAFKRIFRRASYIQAISNYLAYWAQDMGARCVVDVVPNGVDTSVFAQEFSEEELNKLREKYKLKRDDRVIITTSRLVRKNAVDNVIESMQYLSDNTKFLVLGTGPLEKELKMLASGVKTKDRVLFLGYVHFADIPKYLAISDVFVRPSHSEGLGNSFLEAMVAGVPIIGTKIGGIPDFLDDRETGLFCEVGNPKSIAEKINFILRPKNEKLRQEIIVNAKKLVQDKYDWSRVAREMKGVFSKIISDGRATSVR